MRYTSTLNVIPNSITTAEYAAYINVSESKRYSDFKYGSRTYGVTTEYSAGQAMPKVDTKEV